MSKEAQEKIAEELPFPGEEMFARLNYQVDLMSPARGSVIEAYRMAQQDMLEAGYRKLPREKPPLLSYRLIEIWEKFDPEKPIPLLDMLQEIAQAQREADIKWYEGPKEGDRATLQAKDLSFPNEEGGKK